MSRWSMLTQLSRYRTRWLLVAIVPIITVISALSSAPANAGDNYCLRREAAGCTNGLPTFQYQLLLGEMAAHPTPNVRPISVDDTEIGRVNYFRVVGGVQPLYDAPDGHVVGVLDRNFYPVNILNRKGDWVQIYANRWMRARDVTNTATSNLSGVLFDEPLAYPMAWVLVPTRPSAVPGGDPKTDIPMLDRYQRVNIFATVQVGDWNWFLVGPGQWVEERRLARVIPVTRPDGVKGRWIAVNLYEQVAVAYEGDQMIFAALVSTGQARPGFGTNKGLYRIWARFLSTRMSGGMGGPDAYDLPDVPYVMYYDGSISLHGTYWHDGFGYRHSHGCVNHSITDAHWFYAWTDNFFADTWVYVYTTRDYIKSPPGVY